MQRFLRIFTGRVAQFITGARKGRPLGRRFWEFPVFSRIVEWGRSLKVIFDYFELNRLEAEGSIPYQPRKKKRKIKSKRAKPPGL
jgi:hypothetical protein